MDAKTPVLEELYNKIEEVITKNMPNIQEVNAYMGEFEDFNGERSLPFRYPLCLIDILSVDEWTPVTNGHQTGTVQVVLHFAVQFLDNSHKERLFEMLRISDKVKVLSAGFTNRETYANFRVVSEERDFNQTNLMIWRFFLNGQVLDKQGGTYPDLPETDLKNVQINPSIC